MKAQYQRYIAPVLFLATDYVAILLAEKLALWVRNLTVSYQIGSGYIYFWVPIVFLVFLAQSQVYTKMQSLLDSSKKIFYALLYGIVACIALLYFFKESVLVSRLYVGLFSIFVIFTVFGLRYALRLFLKKAHLLYTPVILIGAGKTAERVLRFFRMDLGYRYDITGIIDDHPISKKVSEKFLLYGRFDEAEAIVRDSGIQDVIITAPGLKKEGLQHLIEKIQPHVRNISFVPDLIGTPMAGVEAHLLFNEELLMLSLKNNLASRWNRFVKRVFDLVVGCILSVFIVPILLVLAILIRMDSKGPAFYNASRIGADGKTFKCYKLRSMYMNSDEILRDFLEKNPAAKQEWTEFQKLRDYDPRVTKIGEYIRKYSLDELPQIFNVIKGDMSLVGPRPYLPREKEQMGRYLPVICMTTPGITGLWQVSGRNDISFDGRLRLDSWYVHNWSLWYDIAILFRTIDVVFGRKGAY